MVEMTDGDRKRVRGIMRLRDGLHSQQQPDHFLDLVLFGVAVAHDGLFDQPRAVFGNFKAAKFREQEHDPAHLAELERDAHVYRVERIFNRENIGLEPIQHIGNAQVNRMKPFRERKPGIRPYGAEIDQGIFQAGAFDNTPSEGFASWIDS